MVAAPRTPPAKRPAPRGSRGRGAGLEREAAGEDARIASMLACVRASGLKLTPQRMAIVRELAADPTHPTAQELFERLRPALPTMSFATVYNTLDALASAGLCAALSLSPGAARFDPNMAAHHHAVCDRCGLVRDVPCEPGESPCEPSAEPIRAPLAAAPGFEVRAVERIYRGICAACAKGGQGEGRSSARAREAGRAAEGRAGARGARRPERV
ncbi:FUR family transcriptional regulator [Sorangium cellulosum]|uniref:FUR family transcriptional regulator n=1 Tax=Sorangium cellulosum TaxID=56 RepID=A0A2L0ENJ3_SORCE|nr:transcriptional repressor [Sorangium cellulosum]AUX40856.1 FUR family transcriptional regulator [Sorangium cellulosum]